MAWASASARRARLPPDWSAIQRRILERDRHTCQKCGARANNVDHVITGDDHRDENLQALCQPCHARKSASEGGTARAVGMQGRTPPWRHPPEPHPGAIARDRR